MFWSRQTCLAPTGIRTQDGPTRGLVATSAHHVSDHYCSSTITNMAIARNVQVVSEKCNIYKAQLHQGCITAEHQVTPLSLSLYTVNFPNQYNKIFLRLTQRFNHFYHGLTNNLGILKHFIISDLGRIRHTKLFIVLLILYCTP